MPIPNRSAEKVTSMTITKTIKVHQLARVEGEGGFSLRFKDGVLTQVLFKVFEPPRLFEALLRGRSYLEVPDITARICGICPLAYMLSACQAMEMGFGVELPFELKQLRRLIFYGEWIASHSLHVYFLHAPDYLGYADIVGLAKDHPQIAQRGLKLKNIGNAIVKLIGGREVHPVNLCVGGFYKLPAPADLKALVDNIRLARDAAYETVQWTAGFSFPDFERNGELVALHAPGVYALTEGELVSNRGLAVGIAEFEKYMVEEQVSHSTALHAKSRSDPAGYGVGPLARFNLNFAQLSPGAQKAAVAVGLNPPCTNPFKSIIVRSIEILHACEEVLTLIETYHPPLRPAVEVKPKATIAYGCTEAPRGLCWHKYRLDARGSVLEARIVPPTSQNQKMIETDLRAFAQAHADLAEPRLAMILEQIVRNHDPCISCSSHCLNIKSE
jgi:coenzyme F420-reducing hydrogenase alpha subunit